MIIITFSIDLYKFSSPASLLSNSHHSLAIPPTAYIKHTIYQPHNNWPSNKVHFPSKTKPFAIPIYPNTYYHIHTPSSTIANSPHTLSTCIITPPTNTSPANYTYSLIN